MTYMIAPGLVKEGYKNVIDHDVWFNKLDLGEPIYIPVAKFYEMWQIFSKVCDLYKQNPKEVYKTNSKRLREFVIIRQLSMTLFRKRLNSGLYPLSVCGKFFRLDHATCLYAIKTVNNLIETDKTFREFTKELFI